MKTFFSTVFGQERVVCPNKRPLKVHVQRQTSRRWVSGDNEMTRRMEVQRARRCSEEVRIEELMALVGMIERHARE